jgi:hypothetical protein
LFYAILDKASGLIIGRGGEAIKEMVDRRQVFSKVLLIGYIYIYMPQEIYQGNISRRCGPEANGLKSPQYSYLV